MSLALLQGQSSQMSVVLIKGWSDVSSVVTGVVRCHKCCYRGGQMSAVLNGWSNVISVVTGPWWSDVSSYVKGKVICPYNIH